MTTTDVLFLHYWGTDELGRSNHQQVSIINKEPRRIGYQIWFDEDQISGILMTK